MNDKRHGLQDRFYRNRVTSQHLTSFRVTVKETDLWIHAGGNFSREARESILMHRSVIESYIAHHPDFATTLVPWRSTGPVPAIIHALSEAGRQTGVGPMAAVAGVLAEQVGRDLIPFTDEVIVENGGDIFMRNRQPLVVGIFAGASPLSLRIGLRVAGQEESLGVCTSSGTVGHSLSFGRADAVCVVSSNCGLADAAATSIGNRIGSPKDIPAAIRFGKSIRGVKGLVVVVEDKMGAWGDLELVPTG